MDENSRQDERTRAGNKAAKNAVEIVNVAQLRGNCDATAAISAARAAAGKVTQRVLGRVENAGEQEKTRDGGTRAAFSGFAVRYADVGRIGGAP
jgi:hypothetical protein